MINASVSAGVRTRVIDRNRKPTLPLTTRPPRELKVDSRFPYHIPSNPGIDKIETESTQLPYGDRVVKVEAHGDMIYIYILHEREAVDSKFYSK